MITRQHYISAIKDIIHSEHKGTLSITTMDIRKILDYFGMSHVPTSLSALSNNIRGWEPQHSGDNCPTLSNLKLLHSELTEPTEIIADDECAHIVVDTSTSLKDIVDLLPAAITETAVGLQIDKLENGMWDLQVRFYRV
jgi:hypothetical protein